MEEIFSGNWWGQGVEVEPNQFVDFGCDLELGVGGEALSEARIFLTAGSWFSLWVNGEFFLHGPPREVAPWQYYEEVDLRGYLREGVNFLRVRAYHLGVQTGFSVPGIAGLRVGGQIVGDGIFFDLSERRLWRAAKSPSFLAGAARLHSCIGFGERVDLALDQKDWVIKPVPESWKEPAEIGNRSIEKMLPVRQHLLARDMPQFVGEVWRAKFFAEAGDWQVWDFGRVVFGFLGVWVETVEGGTCTLLHGESLTASGLPDWNYAGGDWREVLEMPMGMWEWDSFEKRALRWLALPRGFRVHALQVEESHWPLEEVWRESEAGKQLDGCERAIVEAAARSLLVNCDDLLTDTPRRERAQYTDPALAMRAYQKLFGTLAPIRRWLIQFSRGAGKDGLLQMSYPGPRSTGSIPDFSIAYAGYLRQYGEMSGDWELVGELLDLAVAGVSYFEKFEDDDGLLRDVPGWVFLCNSFEVAKHPKSAALNALYAAGWEHLSVLVLRTAGLAEGRSAAHGRKGQPSQLLPSVGGLADGRNSSPRKVCPYAEKAARVRSAWRAAFLRDGRVLDADSSIEHEKCVWWNYHHEASRRDFFCGEGEPEPFHLKVRYLGGNGKLCLAANGGVRIVAQGQEENYSPAGPWSRPPIFEPSEYPIPSAGEIVFVVAYNRIDWEIYFEIGGAEIIEASVYSLGNEDIAEAVELRPWSASQHNQISVGYAVACGMLDVDEARPILESCVREHYYVPWLKRTTPLIAEETADLQKIAERATLCNTPQSLYYFCAALRRCGMEDEARKLCRKLFGAMIDSGATTLWEEFAPRSSLSHAWGAFCVDYFL